MKTMIHIRKTLNISLITIALTSFYSIKAQDILVKTDSSMVQTIIEEISSNEIKYRLFNYSDGPRFTISKNEVAYIKYKNGLTEIFGKSSASVNNISYNPNRYNLDAAIDPVVPCAYKKVMDVEALYKWKNYFGVNYLSFLNTCLGFNYMRDFRKQNLILNVPFAFGIGKPNMSNAFYGNNYLSSHETNAHYSLLKYQAGLSILFSPSMTSQTNFLIGPSFSYTGFDVEVNTEFAAGTVVTTYTNTNSSPSYTYNTTQTIYKKYENQFVLNRFIYGMNLGFLARVGERINLNALMTLGVKSDTYSKKDPFGLDYIESQGGTIKEFDYKYNAKPHFNLALSVGYRF